MYYLFPILNRPSILFIKGYLETEVNFYDKLIPELRTLGTPLPHLFPYLWGDYETHSKEVLLLERRNDYNLAPLSSEGIKFFKKMVTY